MIDYIENEKKIYIVTELVEGGNLLDFSKSFKIQEAQIALIMYQILQALSYLHSCGIIHRDIKPENILIERDLNVINIKLADFGLSQIITPQQKLTKYCGTSSYFAPEILFKKGYHQQIDIWAAGIVFYGLLCNNRLPFEINNRQKNFIPISFNDQNPYYRMKEFDSSSRESQNLIVKMLNKDPENRISIEDSLNHKFFAMNGLSKN